MPLIKHFLQGLCSHNPLLQMGEQAQRGQVSCLSFKAGVCTLGPGGLVALPVFVGTGHAHSFRERLYLPSNWQRSRSCGCLSLGLGPPCLSGSFPSGSVTISLTGPVPFWLQGPSMTISIHLYTVDFVFVPTGSVTKQRLEVILVAVYICPILAVLCAVLMTALWHGTSQNPCQEDTETGSERPSNRLVVSCKRHRHGLGALSTWEMGDGWVRPTFFKWQFVGGV